MIGSRQTATRFAGLIAVCTSLCVAQSAANAQSTAIDGSEVFDSHLISDVNPVVAVGGSCGCCDTGCYDGSAMPAPIDPADPTAPAPEGAPMGDADLSFLSASSQGALGGSSHVAMIGDFFGPVVPTDTALGADAFGSVAFISTSGTPGFQSGRQKIVENTSPVPQDRVFFNYSYFDNTPLVPGGMPVNRFTPGFEKTFMNGNMSFEARFPFSSTVSSDTIVDSDAATVFGQNTNQLEMGNITLYVKAILHEGCTHAVTAGLGVALPTANDQRVLDISREALLEVQNESVHLLPFIGGLYTPNDRFFAQAFLQFDIDANGNPVLASGGDDGVSRSGLADLPPMHVGTVNDPTFLYFDVGLGYWIYRNACCDACVSGIAPRVELHYNASITDPDVVSFTREGPGGAPTGLGFDGAVATGIGDFENINALLGTTVELHHNSTLTAAYVVPVGGGSDQVFDGELRVLLNYFYGPGGTDRRSVYAR